MGRNVCLANRSEADQGRKGADTQDAAFPVQSGLDGLLYKYVRQAVYECVCNVRRCECYQCTADSTVQRCVR